MPEYTPIVVPNESVNDTESTVIEWKIECGDWLTKGNPLLEMENSKTSFEVLAPKDAYYYFNAKPNTRIPVGKNCAISSEIELSDESWQEELLDHSQQHQKNSQKSGHHFTAKAYKKIIELGLNENDFPSEQLVRLKEVRAMASIQQKLDIERPHDLKPLSPEKKREIDYLEQSSRDHILSSVSISINLKQAQEKELKIQADIKGAQLGEILCYEAIQALQKFPNLNSQYSQAGIKQFENCHLGVALNLGSGLRVPVIPAANQLSLKDFILANKELYLKYIKNSFDSDDFSQGSFTITNLFSLGVRHFSPIPLPNQTCILGICGPSGGYDDFLVTLSFDHRVSDGMEAAQYLNHLKKQILH
jgi:pyruvate/2-oxoglutarate dehydrogenase complex dihydrolipoamide acyltransferase (E2) component